MSSVTSLDLVLTHSKRSVRYECTLLLDKADEALLTMEDRVFHIPQSCVRVIRKEDYVSYFAKVIRHLVTQRLVARTLDALSLVRYQSMMIIEHLASLVFGSTTCNLFAPHADLLLYQRSGPNKID